MNRRNFLRCAGASLLPLTVGLPSWAQEAPERANDFWLRPRRIRMRHASGERIDALYWSDGQIVEEGYVALSYFMRDRVVNQGVYMHHTLLDILYGVGGWLDFYGVRSDIVLNNAYRQYLRNLRIEGAAKDSLHTRGEAGDILIPGVNTAQAAKFGIWLGGGGVGWYPSKGFIHLDRGRVRSWRG
jgi:uncharacterized protein YcbK (DUF882 family)